MNATDSLKYFSHSSKIKRQKQQGVFIKLKPNGLICIITALTLTSTKSYSFWGDGGAGWAQIPYLVKILAENIKRYQQLKAMVDTAKNRDQYIRLINSGLENSIGLLNSLPIKDEKILSEIRSFQKAFNTIQKVYGVIPLIKSLHVKNIMLQSKCV